MRDDARQGRLRRLHTTYQRLPLPPGVRALLRHAMRRARHAAGALRRRLHAAAAFRPPLAAPALPDTALPDYVVWGVIDWSFRYQRPQQLARTLSASGRRVFYIEATLQDDEREGFAARQLDADGRLFGITLFARGAPTIYGDAPAPSIVGQLRRSVGELLHWAASGRVVSLVQHPFWCEVAAVLPNSRLVYDCLDNHEGFGNNANAVLALEQRLMRQADLVSFSSAWLAEHWAGQRVSASALIRNAADHAFFCAPPAKRYRDRDGRRVIGYYGAIAEWFDADLVAAVASAFPDCVVILVGADTAGVRAQLGRHPNIRFVGEIPYSELPYYLYGFDVCLLPFRIGPLTLATNPIKAYEYLSTGKPVVSVDLPEMRQFGELIEVARDRQNFVAAVGRALTAPASDEAGRRRFSSDQTWEHRVKALVETAEDCRDDPLVSIVVVTYNNLALTQACLASIEADRDCFRGEVIVVDNASNDGTPEFLRQWSARSGHRIILNDSNRGFAAANNQGLATAHGEYLALLNNDTQVTAGWTVTLRRHLQQHPELGLIGPVTNNIGNEARIDVFYQTPAEMPAAARKHTFRHCGELLRLPTLAFFCVMFPRTTYEKIGPLDEEFGLGFFEDDDYCRRVDQAGLGIACAEDVFVHHHLSASFDHMDRARRQALFDKNKAIYERKWGRWIPHRSRRDPS
jgi:GT2 family glycosyltransferase/glycosyltransferase involved in cell wall biosynthesis